RRGADGRARDRDRQGVDGEGVSRHHAARPPAPRRSRLRGRARAASTLLACEAGRATVRVDGGMARGPRRSAPARTRRALTAPVALLLIAMAGRAGALTTAPGVTTAPLVRGRAAPPPTPVAPARPLFRPREARGI